MTRINWNAWKAACVCRGSQRSSWVGCRAASQRPQECRPGGGYVSAALERGHRGWVANPNPNSAWHLPLQCFADCSVSSVHRTLSHCPHSILKDQPMSAKVSEQDMLCLDIPINEFISKAGLVKALSSRVRWTISSGGAVDAHSTLPGQSASRHVQSLAINPFPTAYVRHTISFPLSANSPDILDLHPQSNGGPHHDYQSRPT